MSLDELIDFDISVKEIQAVIDKTSEETANKIDWTSVWSKKYPILAVVWKNRKRNGTPSLRTLQRIGIPL